MPTKKELISDVSFRYLKEFSVESSILHRSGGYFSKEDHVRGISRALSKDECKFLNDSYHDGLDPTECGQIFCQEMRPKEEIVSQHFIDFLNNQLDSHSDVVFTEFPLGKSRADINRFNGSSFTYELKSPRDSFKRLEKQLMSYSEVFEYISTVIPQGFDLPDTIADHVGIIRYNYPDFEFTVQREPGKIHGSDPRQQLELLWLDELTEITGEDGGKDSNSSKDRLIDLALDMYSKDDINELFKSTIKSRYGVQDSNKSVDPAHHRLKTTLNSL